MIARTILSSMKKKRSPEELKGLEGLDTSDKSSPVLDNITNNSLPKLKKPKQRKGNNTQQKIQNVLEKRGAKEEAKQIRRLSESESIKRVSESGSYDENGIFNQEVLEEYLLRQSKDPKGTKSLSIEESSKESIFGDVSNVTRRPDAQDVEISTPTVDVNKTLSDIEKALAPSSNPNVPIGREAKGLTPKNPITATLSMVARLASKIHEKRNLDRGQVELSQKTASEYNVDAQEEREDILEARQKSRDAEEEKKEADKKLQEAHKDIKEIKSLTEVIKTTLKTIEEEDAKKQQIEDAKEGLRDDAEKRLEEARNLQKEKKKKKGFSLWDLLGLGSLAQFALFQEALENVSIQELFKSIMDGDFKRQLDALGVPGWFQAALQGTFGVQSIYALRKVWNTMRAGLAFLRTSFKILETAVTGLQRGLGYVGRGLQGIQGFGHRLFSQKQREKHASKKAANKAKKVSQQTHDYKTDRRSQRMLQKEINQNKKALKDAKWHEFDKKRKLKGKIKADQKTMKVVKQRTSVSKTNLRMAKMGQPKIPAPILKTLNAQKNVQKIIPGLGVIIAQADIAYSQYAQTQAWKNADEVFDIQSNKVTDSHRQSQQLGAIAEGLTFGFWNANKAAKRFYPTISASADFLGIDANKSDSDIPDLPELTDEEYQEDLEKYVENQEAIESIREMMKTQTGEDYDQLHKELIERQMDSLTEDFTPDEVRQFKQRRNQDATSDVADWNLLDENNFQKQASQHTIQFEALRDQMSQELQRQDRMIQEISQVLQVNSENQDVSTVKPLQVFDDGVPTTSNFTF